MRYGWVGVVDALGASVGAAVAGCPSVAGEVLVSVDGAGSGAVAAPGSDVVGAVDSVAAGTDVAGATSVVTAAGFAGGAAPCGARPCAHAV